MEYKQTFFFSFDGGNTTAILFPKKDGIVLPQKQGSIFFDRHYKTLHYSVPNWTI